MPARRWVNGQRNPRQWQLHMPGTPLVKIVVERGGVGSTEGKQTSGGAMPGWDRLHE